MLQDLQNFINDAKDGFIYVSLGTLIEPEFVNEIGLNLMEVFRNISHKIIWKWNKTIIGDVSNNVMIQQWLPQIDILSKKPVTKSKIRKYFYFHIFTGSVNCNKNQKYA